VQALASASARTVFRQERDQELNVSDIRLLSVQDFDALVHIWSRAYPGAKVLTKEERARFRERALQLHEEDPTSNFYGLFREGCLLGIMCFHDFQMNFLGACVPAGGVGQVAVDLLHKKQHVAKEMMGFYLRHYRDRGFPLALLYPFRPDFYRAMGFGYGPKMSQYRVSPAALPKAPSKAHVRALGPDDEEAIRTCYDRVAGRTHGMIYKTDRELRGLFRRATNQIVGVELDDQLQGYLVYTFEHGDNFITNDLHVQEWVYETPEALSGLLTFLHSQADQIRHVLLDSQDEDLHHLLLDPRDGSGKLIPSVYHQSNTQGVGLMVRVIDLPGLLDQLGGHDFGGQSVSLRLSVDDSFLPENAGTMVLRFTGGRLEQLEAGEPDVEARLAIEDLSSLLFGTVAFRSLYHYGRARVSDAGLVDVLTRLFTVEQKPICVTPF
jgi:predicted acetyltransferase